MGLLLWVWVFFQWNVSEKVSHFFILFAFELYFLLKGLENQSDFLSSFLYPLTFSSCPHPLQHQQGRDHWSFKGFFSLCFSHSKFSKDFQLGVMGLDRSAETERLKSELPQALEKVRFTVLSFQKEIGRGRSAERKITILIFLGKKKNHYMF